MCKVLCKCAAFLPALSWTSHASFWACTPPATCTAHTPPPMPAHIIAWWTPIWSLKDPRQKSDGHQFIWIGSLFQWPLQDLQSNPFSAHVAHLLCNGKSLVLCISPYVFRLVSSLFLIYMSHIALTKFTQLANGRWENSTWNCAVIRPIGILSRSWRTDLCLQMSTVRLFVRNFLILSGGGGGGGGGGGKVVVLPPQRNCSCVVSSTIHDGIAFLMGLCHVISTGCQMMNLVTNFEYLSWLFFNRC